VAEIQETSKSFYKAFMQIKKSIYIDGANNYRKQWQLLDKTLIDFCQIHPKHNHLDDVSAKVILVGRGFATGIERHVTSDGYQGSSINKLAKYLVKNSHIIDPIIDNLSNIAEPLTIDTLTEIVKYHGEFCKILTELTRDRHYATSFAAKYLHFHAPIVPIYDSISYKNAWHYRDKKNLYSFEKPKGSDENYFSYSLCFWQYYFALKKLFQSSNVRLTEVYLLWLCK
jgi:hypothetical protein